MHTHTLTRTLATYMECARLIYFAEMTARLNLRQQQRQQQQRGTGTGNNNNKYDAEIFAFLVLARYNAHASRIYIWHTVYGIPFHWLMRSWVDVCLFCTRFIQIDIYVLSFGFWLFFVLCVLSWTSWLCLFYYYYFVSRHFSFRIRWWWQCARRRTFNELNFQLIFRWKSECSINLTLKRSCEHYLPWKIRSDGGSAIVTMR